MAKIFPFLVSLLAHAALRRSGKAGAVPSSFKVPGKSTTRLPVPSAWQVMMISWVAERLWQAFGDDVKQKLTHTKSPAVNKLGQMIPAPGDAAKGNQGIPSTAPPAQPPMQPPIPQTAQSNAVSAQPPVASQAPAQAPSQASSQSRRASKNYNTQKLPQDPLPPGSVLGSLRSS
ncbi:MAG TPA: hypothetical protein VGB77_01420 [Abditibacteriaceae bacterium]